MLSCPGPVSHGLGQDKRASGTEQLHPLPPEEVTDPVLLVHLVSVPWELTRPFHPGSSEQGRGQGVGLGLLEAP